AFLISQEFDGLQESSIGKNEGLSMGLSQNPSQPLFLKRSLNFPCSLNLIS
ncbi:MAG: hypothetical protein PWR14_248, partial [Thermosediminibacterales bacterium]|nr:hypothetical protein [Thermosediminibacterales bacterium]